MIIYLRIPAICLSVLSQPRIPLHPYNFTFLCESRSARDNLRRSLLQNNIYPSILWNHDHSSVNNLPSSVLSLSHDILSLHCDYRYNTSDLNIVLALHNYLLQ